MGSRVLVFFKRGLEAKSIEYLKVFVLLPYNGIPTSFYYNVYPKNLPKLRNMTNAMKLPQMSQISLNLLRLKIFKILSCKANDPRTRFRMSPTL